MSSERKYRTYSTAVGGRTHDPATVDRWLEALLPLDSRPAFESVCNALVAQDGRGHRVDDHGRTCSLLVERFLWGLATRLKEYRGPHSDTSRTVRHGPLTYVELLVVRWAANNNSTLAARARDRRCVGRSDAAYIAALLGRDPATAAVALRKYGPARGRRDLLGD